VNFKKIIEADVDNFNTNLSKYWKNYENIDFEENKTLNTLEIIKKIQFDNYSFVFKSDNCVCVNQNNFLQLNRLSFNRVGYTPTILYDDADGNPYDYFRLHQNFNPKDKKTINESDGLYDMESRTILSLLRVFLKLIKNSPLRISQARTENASAILLVNVFPLYIWQFQYITVKIIKELFPQLGRNYAQLNLDVVTYMYLNIPFRLGDVFLSFDSPLAKIHLDHKIQLETQVGSLKDYLQSFKKENYGVEDVKKYYEDILKKELKKVDFNK
jgi:hypothetical protein